MPIAQRRSTLQLRSQFTPSRLRLRRRASALPPTPGRQQLPTCYAAREDRGRRTSSGRAIPMSGSDPRPGLGAGGTGGGNRLTGGGGRFAGAFSWDAEASIVTPALAAADWSARYQHPASGRILRFSVRLQQRRNLSRGGPRRRWRIGGTAGRGRKTRSTPTSTSNRAATARDEERLGPRRHRCMTCSRGGGAPFFAGWKATSRTIDLDEGLRCAGDRPGHQERAELTGEGRSPRGGFRHRQHSSTARLPSRISTTWRRRWTSRRLTRNRH